MSTFRWVVFGAVVLALLVTGSAMGQDLVPDKTLHDFGMVRDGITVQCVFTLTNRGTTNITVNRVTYNCGCTSYLFLLSDGRTQRAPYTIPAGQSVDLQVSFRTHGYSRYRQPVEQVLTIYSNDPRRSSFQVTIRATVVTTLPSHLSDPVSFAEAHYFLIDLRPAGEFAQGHLFGATNIPFDEFSARVPQLPIGRTYVLYDLDGAQASQAVTLMSTQGHFGRAFFVDGGLIRWQAELGAKFFVWAEGVTPQQFAGDTVGGSVLAKTPQVVASTYVGVVDLSAAQEFARAHVPGSINLTESEALPWAEELPHRLSLSARTELALWVLDDVGGQDACLVAEQLVQAGFNASCIQGGRAALETSTGNELLWLQQDDS